MRRLLQTLTIALAALAAAAGPSAAQSGGSDAPPPSGQPAPQPTYPSPGPTPRLVVGRPSRRTFIREGQGGRFLMGGTWYFRQDDLREGNRRRFYAQRSLRGWTAIGLPHNWNARDTVFNDQSQGWYRKEFRLPRSPRGRRFQWVMRFESVIQHGTVYLNGKKIGSHSGGYLPWEVDLRGLRRGRNRLVVRVSSFRGGNDLTHWRPFGSGGWWNFGGISREVYARRVDGIDVQDAAALTRQRCTRCRAVVGVRIRLRNMGRQGRRVRLGLTIRPPRGGGRIRRISGDPRGLRGRSTRSVAIRFTIRRPALWRPRRGRLYRVTVGARSDDGRRSTYRLAFGVRRLTRTRDGRILLNGRRLNLRGASMHEDEPTTGAALRSGQRRMYVARLRELGATVTRAHYPLHPGIMESLDRAGILYWSQAPIYQLPNANLNRRRVRAAAIRVNRETVLANRNHPSIFVWSLANELAHANYEVGAIGPGYVRFVRHGARTVRKLDRTRLVGIDRHSRIGEPFFNPVLRRLDVIGVNEYFGWYSASAPGYRSSRTSDLSPYLDQVRRAFPRQGLFVTEFGAEATVPGSGKGSFDYQTNFLRQHLAIHASKPYVFGSVIWALKDFRVTPGWQGGNSRARATPPWNNKGLIDQNGGPKPAFYAMRDLFWATRPLR